MRTNADRSLIRQLIQGPGWKLVEQIAQEIVQRTRDTSNLKETEWETAKSVALEEGQIQGINNLIQELYRTAQEE